MERRASSCRNGMGEKMGVVGADGALAMGKVLTPGCVADFSEDTGNASQVDVTRSVRSTARRYFPRNL